MPLRQICPKQKNLNLAKQGVEGIWKGVTYLSNCAAVHSYAIYFVLHFLELAIDIIPGNIILAIFCLLILYVQQFPNNYPKLSLFEDTISGMFLHSLSLSLFSSLLQYRFVLPFFGRPQSAALAAQ